MQNDHPEKYEALTDEQLALLSADNQDAFTQLSMRYIIIIRNRASELRHDSTDFDDLIQEGLIGLHRAALTYRDGGGASFRTYAEVCIRNRLVSMVRMQNRKNRLDMSSVPLEEQTDAQASSETEPENVVLAGESTTEMWERIKELLSAMELSVLKSYLDGLSYGEIAAKNGISEKACNNAMQRVRRKLRTLK